MIEINRYPDNIYGNYRNLKFTDVWINENEFLNDYAECGIPQGISQEYAKTLFYLLYAKYGNSTIASCDVNQFKYKTFATIFSYGPAWEKRVKLQELIKIEEGEIEQYAVGNKQINNHAYNPSEPGSTQSLDELLQINEQRSSGLKRGKLETYGTLIELIETDVTEEFLARFKNLFLIVVAPELPLWYKTSEVDDE